MVEYSSSAHLILNPAKFITESCNYFNLQCKIFSKILNIISFLNLKIHESSDNFFYVRNSLSIIRFNIISIWQEFSVENCIKSYQPNERKISTYKRDTSELGPIFRKVIILSFIYFIGITLYHKKISFYQKIFHIEFFFNNLNIENSSFD